MVCGTERTAARYNSIESTRGKGRERKARRGAEWSWSRDKPLVCIVADREQEREQARENKRKYWSYLSKRTDHAAALAPLSVLRGH